MTSQAVSLITINTWKCEGHYPQRIQWMAEELNCLQPDVLMCQEVFQTPNAEVHTSAFLAKALKMNQIYSLSRYKTRPFGKEMVMSYAGLALLTHAHVNAIVYGN